MGSLQAHTGAIGCMGLNGTNAIVYVISDINEPLTTIYVSAKSRF